MDRTSLQSDQNLHGWHVALSVDDRPYVLPAPDLSSKPAGRRCCCRSLGRTLDRFITLTAYAHRVSNSQYNFVIIRPIISFYIASLERVGSPRPNVSGQNWQRKGKRMRLWVSVIHCAFSVWCCVEVAAVFWRRQWWRRQVEEDAGRTAQPRRNSATAASVLLVAGVVLPTSTSRRRRLAVVQAGLETDSCGVVVPKKNGRRVSNGTRTSQRIWKF